MFAIVTAGSLQAGPFPPAAGRLGSDALAADDSRFRSWAAEVTALERGPEEIDDPFSLAASYGSAASAIGPADVLGTQDQPEPGSPLPKPAVSLGDGGSIILRFDPPIMDGPGPDFAVFENGIGFNGGGSFFMELAFVEASSDGIEFTRFPAFSETQVTTQIPAYGAIDPTNVRNLAGKYIAGHGTPFDLAELAGTHGLDTNRITHIRIVDVVGALDSRYASRDSLGRIINDPWPTFLTTSGFDLDAVGVLHHAVVRYNDWRAQFAWSPSDSAPDADPDHDGVSNTLEYAFDRHPLIPQPAPSVVVSATSEGWIATLPRLRSGCRDLSAEAETSTDLRHWTTAPPAETVLLGAATGSPVYCRLRLHLVPPP